MPHFPKPFYRKMRDRWAVEVDGKQINLGPDRDEAFRLYHKLMQGRPAPSEPHQEHRSNEPILLLELFERFLDHVERERSPATYDIYRDRLRGFTKYLNASSLYTLEAERIRPAHVLDWLATRPKWKPGMRHGAIQAIQRAFNWAVEVGLLSASPVAKMKKPRAGRREITLTQTDFEQYLMHVPLGSFVELVRFVWATGSRPQEAIRLEARHFDFVHRRAVMDLGESKGKQKVRVLYLPDTIVPQVKELCRQYPKGKVFRNSEGQPWNPSAVSHAWGRVQVRMGQKRMEELGIEVDEKEVERLAKVYQAKHPKRSWAEAKHQIRKSLRHRMARKHAPKLCCYHLRHSFATNALKKNVDAVTVAVLMGHSDPSMVSRVYSHLSQDPEYLRKSIEKAVANP